MASKYTFIRSLNDCLLLFTMTKTVSARVNNETHQHLVNICNELGKTMNELLNDWIKSQSRHSNVLHATDQDCLLLKVQCITMN